MSRHRLFLDSPTQVGKNRITLPPALANYYGNTAQAYVNGRQVESKAVKGIRYIRDWTSGSSLNGYSVWTEIQAFVGETNVALNKDVSLDDEVLLVSSYPISSITDGFIGTDNFVAPSNTTNIHWAKVDLGDLYEVDNVLICHSTETNRTFYDTKTEVSADGVNWNTIFDSAVEGTYTETTTGVTHTVPDEAKTDNLTFTTPTPTREIEIGRGNLELTDTSSANEVEVLHWTPSSDAGYYWVLSQGVEYILYGLPQIAVKHDETENLANQTAVKTDESESAANQTAVKENITKHLAGKTKVVEAITDYLTTLVQVYEQSPEVLGVTDTIVKENIEENTTTQATVKQTLTSNYPAFAKVVESFTDYLTNQTEVKEISAIVDGITNTIVKAVENNYALNQTAVKENAAAENLMSKVRVLQAQTDYLMNTTGVYVNFDLSAPAQNTIKNTESTYTVPTAKVVESYYQYLNTLATIDEAYGLNSWSGLETTDLDDMIPDYIHGFESLGHSYTSGQLEPVLKNITKDLTYQIGTFTGTTGKAKDGDYAMVYMPCEPGSYTVKIPQSVQLRSTDKLVVQDCLTLPADAESSAVITSTELNAREQTVTITGNWLGFGIMSDSTTYFEVDFDEISINTYIDRGSQELPQLHGIDGVYSDTTSKRVEVETGVSGTGSVTYNGETFVAINESTGDPTWGDLAGAKSLSLSAGTYTVIYVLTDALTQDAKARMMTRFIYGDKNNYLVTHSKLDTFAGDGSTTAYTLTATADGTNYDVYVAGRPADATKTTTGFSFSTAPKRGAIIEARYNLGINTTWFMTLNIYEPSGTEVTISGIPELSISANKEFYEREDRLGDKEQKLKYKDYTITLNTDLLEDSQSFYDTWKDKKFRMIIENTAGSTYEKDIAAVCEITGHTKNYLGALESITIKATDYYEGVTA